MSPIRFTTINKKINEPIPNASATKILTSSSLSQKWIFAVMGFLAMFCALAMRNCLPLTIPQMVKTKKQIGNHLDDSCPFGNETSAHRNETTVLRISEGLYDWSEHTQGIVLGSFYVGYTLSHLPGGLLAERFGGKHVVGIGLLGTAVMTSLTCLVTKFFGWRGLALLRISAGLCEGMVQPGLSTMLARWVPPSQRSSLSSIVFNGASFGLLSSSGLLGSITRAWGWSGPHYAWAAVSCFWWLGWCALCHSSPQRHPRISASEKCQLAKDLGTSSRKQRVPPLPLCRLLSSGPFWALVAGSAGRDWAGHTCESDMPKYAISVLHLSVDELGRLFMWANVLSLTSSTLLSWLTDQMIEQGFASRTNARKMMATVGLMGFGLGNLLAAYAGCDKILFAALVLVGWMAAGAGYPGVKANALDLSSNYAGTVMAISHGLSGLCGIAGPYLVGILVVDQTLEEWRLVFWMIFIVPCIANIIFLVLADGEVQDWDDCQDEEEGGQELEDPLEEKLKLMELSGVILTPEQVQSREETPN
ncbi:hypothetical protein QAD02_017162 [Eretmocerus hayati]|uniref:Uncharacterized protein n=1 Tax=Eretmocerus hayati TaxID=131215 RepID=A0ACC2PHX7_9HYME|nr:hypothetical protein QAD02_017162 [Eretmocerus hayati]